MAMILLKKSHILSLITLLMLVYPCFSQQENTLFFMDRIPQSNGLNPAQHPNCKWWLGGQILPISPNLHLDFSTPLSIGDMIYENPNGDSLQLFWRDKKSQQKFFDEMNDVNTINFNFEVNWLTAGIRDKNNFWSISLSDKTSTAYMFPKAFFTFPLQGNISPTNREQNFSGFGLDVKWYRELSIGYSRKIDPVTTLGVHVKLLQGIYAITTPKSELRLINDSLSTELKTKADYQINVSIPIDSVAMTNKRVDDVIMRKMSVEELKSTVTNFDNKGIAFDLGLVHEWNTELTICASLIDFGFINWARDAHSFSFSDTTIFKGVEVNPLTLSNNVNVNIDSITKNMELSHEKKSFTTWLNPKIYLGGNYKITKRIAIGLMGRLERTPFQWQPAGTLSLNCKTFKWGTISVSNSIVRNTFFNVGLGYTMRIGPVQWFSVWEWNPIFNNARYYSMRLGANLVFGRDAEGIKTKKHRSRKNMPLLMTF